MTRNIRAATLQKGNPNKYSYFNNKNKNSRLIESGCFDYQITTIFT